MHRLSRNRGETQDPDREPTPLSFRSVALLFPPKDALQRVRPTSGAATAAAAATKPIDPLFDHDDTKTFPLSSHDEPRVIIAQDTAGVSVDKLLYDSRWSRKSRKDGTHETKAEAKPSSFRPSSSSSSHTPADSGFLPRRQSRGSISAAPDGQPQQPSSTSAFAPSNLRRLAVPSLADMRHDPTAPAQDSAEEMDSWLDCMFGRAPMRYKGAVTRLHHVRRRPSDPPGSRASTPTDNALLVSTTFAVNIHDEDLPEQLPSASQDRAFSRRHSSDRQKQFSTPMFGVAILLPLAQPRTKSDDHGAEYEQADDESDPVQAVVEKWHMYARALHALQNAASLGLQQCLRKSAHAHGRKRSLTSPASAASTSSRLVKLDPRGLEHAADINVAAMATIDRIFRISKVLRVEPQGEWNIWRDELRDYVKISQQSDSKRGLFNVSKINFVQACLTAALSIELGWLHTFAPPQHQSRLRDERRHNQSVLDMAQNRIVVTTVDQNQARNLVFIFAKLFSQTQALAQPSHSRRSSQNSLTTLSAKRVSAITQGLEAAKIASSGAGSNGQVNGTFADQDVYAPAMFEPPAQASPCPSPVKLTPSDSVFEPARKPGIVTSTGRIDIPGKATPAVPVSAPGSTRDTPMGSPEDRSGSGASAHGDLMRHLQRSSSTTTSNGSTDTGSIWSSFRSSSWSLKPRRESSVTERSDSGGSNAQREQQPTGILKTSKSASTRHGSSKLVRMVEDSTPSQDDERKDSAMHTRESTSVSSNEIPHKTAVLQFNPPVPEASDITYTYNQDEGVVDVEFPGCSVSRTSSRSLPNKATRCKVPSARHQFPNFETARRASKGSLQPGTSESAAQYDRVAGYLDRFHPDFALQATKPYASLLEEVKRAMKAEPSPKMELSENLRIFSHETWIDICSTIVIDAEALVVKKLTLRRHVRYKLVAPDEPLASTRRNAVSSGRDRLTTSHTGNHHSSPRNEIKITRSEDMDSIRRTYKRNDSGQKTSFRDQRVLKVNTETSSSLPEQHIIETLEHGLSGSPESLGSRSSKAYSHDKARVSKSISVSDGRSESGDKRSNSVVIGDDISAFIDRKQSHKTTAAASAGIATKRVAIKNKEGKITGWKDVKVDTPDEAGLNDLPAGFMERRHDRCIPVVECVTLDETFDEEVITKADSAIINLLQQMIATSEPRSRTHSRAGSIQSHAPSRSNSINGSGLSELQFESKKIIENILEGLVSTVASDRYSSTTSFPGGLFKFGRTASSTPESSLLRQSITKWMYGEA